MILSPASRAMITSALKRSNQRLAQLSKTLKQANADKGFYDPRTDSAIYKREIAPFMSDEYKQYMSTSKAGRVFYKYENGQKMVKNVTTGGNDKFDIKKIMKAIESGQMDYSEANDFLVKAAGIRISEDGTVTPTSVGGISTTRDIKEEAALAIGDDFTDEELLQNYDELTDFRESFQTDYDAFKYQESLQAVDEDETIKRLLGENRAVVGKVKKGKNKGQEIHEPLSYEELMKIHKKIKEELRTGKKTVYGGN